MKDDISGVQTSLTLNSKNPSTQKGNSDSHIEE
jgi:hypothetical protein